MQEEYNYTLTVPLADRELALPLIKEMKERYPQLRVSNKPDTSTSARYYLCFPYKGTRSDLKFQEWIADEMQDGWDLFGPNYGIWGLK